MLRSVRFRITAIAAVAVAVVLTVVAVLLLAVQRQQLADNLDRSLRARADALQTLELESDGGAGPVVIPGTGDDVVVQVVAADGTVLAATANAVDGGPLLDAPDDGERITTVASLPIEDDEYRVLSRPIDTDVGPATLHVAENTDDQQDLVQRLRTFVSVAIPIAVVLLSAMVWWLVGRTLRPVESIRATVETLGRDVSERVPEPGSGDEIDRLASTMNDMLARLEQANAQQQRFVADASHELRSPLARLRAEFELASRPAVRGEDADVSALSASAIEEVDRLAALVDDLLVLARSDAGAMTLDARPVDLDDIVLAELDDLRSGRGSTIEIDARRVSAAHVHGDPAQLRRVVRNLFDNASRHTRSRIEVGLVERPGADGVTRAQLVVADDGPGIPADGAARIFDRFTRVDAARTAGAGGTGLGLAIARDIVERHGGTIELDAGNRPGARFVVELPAG